MNSSSRVDFLLNATANNAQSKAKSTDSSVASSEFKAQFKNQLKTEHITYEELQEVAKRLNLNTIYKVVRKDKDEENSQ